MKKKIFGGIAVLAFTAIVGLNISLNLEKKKSPNLSLNHMHMIASASPEGGGLGGFLDAIGNWWDKKAYTCVEAKCSAVTMAEAWGTRGGTWIRIGYREVYGPGKKFDCGDGNSVAHCWDCNDDCIPLSNGTPPPVE